VKPSPKNIDNIIKKVRAELKEISKIHGNKEMAYIVFDCRKKKMTTIVYLTRKEADKVLLFK